MQKPSFSTGFRGPSRGENLNGLGGLRAESNRRTKRVNVHYSDNFSVREDANSVDALIALMTAFWISLTISHGNI
ncbi:hypothetical protein EC847_11660 [Scandinavium goeteborgense]|uniref:Uncharacterized protein n=1 Tax=Scandinavium goeteborgense TaxID=1851514 RepID=A0A4V6PQN8_SCAGO|nr:hypothetical protein EC847_11660 [Scandinavium goeteborgense]